MDVFWADILGANGASGASYMLQQNSRGGYRVIGGRNKTHSKGNAPLAPLTPLGADPHDTEERQAIQQEGNKISDLPDKPILSLAEQAALVLDGYNGDKEQAAADLRTVARNFALADYVEAGNSAPQPTLAGTTPMTPDRGPEATFIDPLAEARTLLTVMRRVGLRVRLTSGDQLRIGPDRMLWPYDREYIAEHRDALIALLKQELPQ